MLRIVTTMLLAAFAVPALAAPVPTDLVTPHGEHCRYTSELKGKFVAIRGEMISTGDRIDLTVDAFGRVEGSIGTTPISFRVPQSKRGAIVASLSAPAIARTPVEAQLAATQ